MNKWIFTPSFGKPELMEDFLQKIEVPKGFVHVIIWDHYPIKKEQNLKAIQKLALDYGCLLIQTPKNLGLHHGLNYGMQAAHVQPDDFYINCDADDRPSAGLFEAMLDVMGAKKKIAVLGCSFEKIQRQLDALLKIETIAGHKVIIHPNCEMWNISTFDMRFIESVGGFNEHYAFYGGLESWLYQHWPKKGLRLGYLKDFRSDASIVDPDLVDPEFTAYKLAHTRRGFMGSFEDYLKTYCPKVL